jgi:predicted nucleic acid-binding protein
VLLYLGLNCFSRPFDDHSQDRIAQETAAVFVILQRIIVGVDRLVWSAILTFENAQHPLADRRTEIVRWAQRAVVNVAVTQQVATRARALTAAGFRPLDAAHLACAEAAACDRFLTCDDQVIRRARRVRKSEAGPIKAPAIPSPNGQSRPNQALHRTLDSAGECGR